MNDAVHIQTTAMARASSLRRVLLLWCALLAFQGKAVWAQVVSNNGAVVSLTSGAVVVAKDVENTTGTLSNAGTITLSGSYSNAGTTEGSGTYDIGGNLTISAGTFDLGTGTANRASAGGVLSLSTGAVLKLGGSSGGVTGSNFPNNYATVTLDGTVEFNGSGAQTVPAFNYYNLTLSNSGTKTFSAGTHGIAGVFAITGSASADATTNSPAINYNGASPQTVLAITYYDLTLSGGGDKTPDGSLTVNHDFSNSVVTSMGTYGLSIGGAKTNTGTMKFAGATNGVVFAGGTVEYNGTTAQAPAGQTIALGTYGHLVFSNTATKIVTGGTVQTNADLTVPSGIAVQVNADGILTVVGDWDMDGSLTNNGVINVGP